MKIKKVSIIIVLIIILIVCSAITSYYMFYSPALKVSNELKIYIDKNDNADSLKIKIYDNLRPIAYLGWQLLDKIYSDSNTIRTGYYVIDPNCTSLSAYRKIRHGMQTPVRLVINNARTTEILAGKISAQLMADSTELINALKDTVICSKYGYNPSTIIAMFIPNTYEVYWDTTIQKLLDRMNKEHNKFWNKQKLDKAKEIGLSPIEITILASIVDEETTSNEEKPIIAGLYINRLKIGMPLQADPTIKFALGDFTIRRILKKHLEINSPYNTYKNQGLPPGPICMASISGINSVINYQKSNFLYMCAKEDFSGKHNFATNISEHYKNARKYQKALNERNIK